MIKEPRINKNNVGLIINIMIALLAIAATSLVTAIISELAGNKIISIVLVSACLLLIMFKTPTAIKLNTGIWNLYLISAIMTITAMLSLLLLNTNILRLSDISYYWLVLISLILLAPVFIIMILIFGKPYDNIISNVNFLVKVIEYPAIVTSFGIASLAANLVLVHFAKDSSIMIRVGIILCTISLVYSITYNLLFIISMNLFKRTSWLKINITKSK